jgi:biopolymer transport protein ExbD
MTSMVDVVFLLLVFFLWTTSFEQPEYDLASAIAAPPAGTTAALATQTPPPLAFDEIVIRLSRGEESIVQVRFNDRVVADVAELIERLRSVVTLGAQPPVIVQPDDDVSIGEAIKIYDAVRFTGLDRVLFAVKE